MSGRVVYLCGPINGCTDAECKDWRSYAKEHLWKTIDPMKRDYRGREAESYREIVELDKLDVRTCDVVLANCPKPSVGTSMEVFYAWQLGKPVVAVVEGPVSPWLRYHATKVCGSVREACDWINWLSGHGRVSGLAYGGGPDDGGGSYGTPE